MTTVAEKQLAKGENFIKEAEDMLNKPSGGCCGMGSRSREEQACVVYVQAANAFKMAKEWHRAGNAFAESAALQLKNDRKTEAGMNYVEAAKCYKKVSPTECEQCLVKAGEIYDDVGRGKTAAKQHLTLAELHEEQGNNEKALEEYQKAADMFSGVELASSSTKCLTKVAYFSAILGDYKRAETLFVELGNAALDNKLLKYTATEHFMRAGLCHLASNPQDQAGLLQKMAEWRDTSPAFADCREHAWLLQMAEACQKGEVDDLNEAIRSYESVSRLAEFEQSLIKTIRKYMSVAPDLR